MFAGVDIGGTFTDLVLAENGRLHIHKRPSTPDNPADAMLAGLAALGVAPDARISHGTTVATNAILERKGARTALITTRGFRDLLFIGRQSRPVLYALQPALPPPLIPRERCHEVPERLDHHGAVLQPLDMRALDAVLDSLVEQEVESVAVCLLYSFVNPQHERAIRARILQRGLMQARQVSLSCEVLPEFREYERASTVALEAWVRPVMTRYLRRLEEALPTGSRLLVMKSDGGVSAADEVREQALQTALSGPAAGVIGASWVARIAGHENIITLDMGGTSTDVALCPGGPARRADAEIDGMPLRLRVLDIETIGAGGGSLVRLDGGGALRVGPQSAGADPGPMIYNRGGRQLTVSDANALLGRIDPGHFLGGGMRLELDGARRAMAELARAMQLSPEAAARGVIDVAAANIDCALRQVSIARGHDPRDFTLMAFGGAGPLHACDVAEHMEMRRILVPRWPGVLCALGLLVADVLRESSRSVLALATAGTLQGLRVGLEEMTQRARAQLAREGIPDAAMRFQALLDLRYAGQSYELTLPFSEDPTAAFHEAHRQQYGHALPRREVEVVNLRLQAIGLVDKPLLEAEPEDAETAAPLLHERDGIAHYERDSLLPGMRIEGPALLLQLDSTVWVAPAWTARVDPWRNVLLEHNADDSRN